MKNEWALSRKGFTIVELLIVIVVIAILATITIVSYSGIQQRARNAAISTAVDAWDQVLKTAAIDGYAMPPVGACLGQSGDFSAKDGFPSGACVTVNGTAASGVSYSDSNFSSWISPAVRRPSGELPIITYNVSGSQIKSRGIWVGSADVTDRTIELRWLAQIDGQCAKGSALTAPIVGSLTGGYCSLTVNY